MTTRNISGSDIERIPAIWHKDQPFVPVTVENFLNKIIFEENFSPRGFFIAEEDGEIAGFCISTFRSLPVICGGTTEPGKGYITGFCVPDRSRTGTVGRALLEAAESYLYSNGVRRISTGYFPVYYVQGIEEDLCPEYVALFEEMGYTIEERSYSLEYLTENFRPDEGMEALKRKLLEEGITVRPGRIDDCVQLIDPKKPFSKESWAYEYRARLRDRDFTRFTVAEDNGVIIGNAPFGDPGSDAGRFGPFGVNPEYRGRGLGKLMMYECLKEMKRRGIPRVWMQWVEDGGAAWHIYEKAGFRKLNTFITYEKEL